MKPYAYLWITLFIGLLEPLLAQPFEAEALDKIARELERKNIVHTMLVYDLAKGKALFARHEKKLLNPASAVKLFTVATALHDLKPDFRFKTEYYLRGNIVSGVLQGDLVVKGYGDPTVVSERLMLVAREIALQGIKSIKGRLIFDITYFDDKNIPKGYVEEETPDRAYNAPISALSFNYNAITIDVRPTKLKAVAKVSLEPPVSYLQLKKNTLKTSTKTDLQIASVDAGAHTQLSVSGSLAIDDKRQKYYRRIYNAPLYFMSALDYYLGLNGVSTRHSYAQGVVEKDDHLVYTDMSPSLSAIVQLVNQYSNNFIAEMLVKALGAQVAIPATFDNGLAKIATYIESDLGISEENYKLGNGSGLNDANRFSAEQFVALLKHVKNDFQLAPEFESSLCVAGVHGAAGKRLKESDAKRRVRAKTGTLTGVNALAGYALSPDDKTLAFVMVMNKSGMSLDAFWEYQGRFVDAIAGVVGGE